ncbi:T9SS type A sorting domain-containing protein [Chitinophaga varians]|uniref:T9SS type A sorting domain-containing protein n=1 Tax=Chitinophaga varians TaxID=2202339 RepID=UPI00165EC638|nr:T9SS type A sorting domain-containing protein [Chitinophaga varians]MBC9912692.1 T9SS type A sorting domain-containing protein [Chitinophaga varians]
MYISLLLLLPATIAGQSATWLHADARIGIFGKDTISIFGDMVNEGNILSTTGSVVNFFGFRWRNSNNADIHDESPDGFSAAGGLFRFVQSDPALYQHITGGFSAVMNTGTSFPNLSVETSPGVILDDLSDLKVVNVLDIRKGHVFLNGWNLVVGHHTPGDIRHYSPQRFIVTGGGFLYRKQMATTDGTIVFPVGTRPSSFTPAAIANKGATSDFRVGVTDSTFFFLTTGRNLLLTSINKTWQIDVSRPDASVNLWLVHGFGDEGPVYEANRNTSYLARYLPSGWDVAAQRAAPVSPSIFSTAGPDNQAAYGVRSFQHLATTNYFTSLVAETVNSPERTTLQYFEANRSSTDADSVLLRWITGREYFCAGFTIERKYAGTANFDSIGFVKSSAPGGISYFPVGYPGTDYQPNDQFIFYRLKVIMTDGSFFYGPVRLVKGKNAKGDITVWPNPVRGRVVHIYYGAGIHVKAIALLDVPGRRILTQEYQQPLPTRNYYELDIPSYLARGIYFLQFLDENGQTIHTEKIVLME